MSDVFDSEENRDRLAEAWLVARHGDGWYLGSATLDEWAEAYAAVDDPIETPIWPASVGVSGRAPEEKTR